MGTSTGFVCIHQVVKLHTPMTVEMSSESQQKTARVSCSTIIVQKCQCMMAIIMEISELL